MKEKIFWSHSSEDTENLGKTLGSLLEPPLLLLLIGDLGTGKTTFVRGLARGLGISSGVNSPSFALIQEYNGRIPLYHIDLYRLSQPEDLETLGLEEYLSAWAVVAIEWPEIAQPLLTGERLEVRFSLQNDDRELHLIAFGQRVEQILERWDEGSSH